MPELTEERRKEYVKIAKGKAEDGKVAVRNIRRKAKESLDKAIKDGDMGEDEGDRLLKELDKVTKQTTDELDALLETKQKGDHGGLIPSNLHNHQSTHGTTGETTMEKQEQREKKPKRPLTPSTRKTGRNMPQAIATAVVLIAIILASLLISVDLFVYLVVLFMVLALWELRVDFATAGLIFPWWRCGHVPR